MARASSAAISSTSSSSCAPATAPATASSASTRRSWGTSSIALGDRPKRGEIQYRPRASARRVEHELAGGAARLQVLVRAADLGERVRLALDHPQLARGGAREQVLQGPG